MTTQAKPTATATNADATIAKREQRVIEFFTSWSESFEAFCDSFALLAEDCVWDQRPIPRLIGPQQAVRFLKLARATLGLVTIDVEILHIASAGQIVHVQRVDRLRRADGSLIVAAPVAGCSSSMANESSLGASTSTWASSSSKPSQPAACTSLGDRHR
jgi:limonene-1,2-epoxide hydrolase